MNHPIKNQRRATDKTAPIRLVCAWLRVAFRPEIQFARAIARRPLVIPEFRDGCRSLVLPRRHALNRAAAVVTISSRHASPPR